MPASSAAPNFSRDALHILRCPCHILQSHRITCTFVAPALSPGAAQRHIGSQPPHPAAQPRMTPSQPDRAPWGSQPRPRPHHADSCLCKRSSAIRSARLLSCIRFRCLPPVATPFARRIPCSRSSASSRRKARAVAMLRAMRSSIAAFSASRVASLQATAPSLAMIAALASAAASARCTRLCHARCSVHAAVCACLHDGKKLFGDGGSADHGGGGGFAVLSGGSGSGACDGRSAVCCRGTEGGEDAATPAVTFLAAAAAFLAAALASLASRLHRSSPSLAASRAFVSALRCARACSSAPFAVSAASLAAAMLLSNSCNERRHASSVIALAKKASTFPSPPPCSLQLCSRP